MNLSNWVRIGFLSLSSCTDERGLRSDEQNTQAPTSAVSSTPTPTPTLAPVQTDSFLFSGLAEQVVQDAAADIPLTLREGEVACVVLQFRVMLGQTPVSRLQVEFFSAPDFPDGFKLATRADDGEVKTDPVTGKKSAFYRTQSDSQGVLSVPACSGGTPGTTVITGSYVDRNGIQRTAISPLVRILASNSDSLGDSSVSGEALRRDASSFPGEEGVAVSFGGDIPFPSIAAAAEAWVVTDDTVIRIELDRSKGWPQTQWTMPNNTGNRTFVTELGLLVGRTNFGNAQSRGVWLAPRDVPGAAVKIYDPPDMGSQSRLAVTSFKLDSQPYIGFAYGTELGEKKFVRIPIDKTKPNGIDLSRAESHIFSSLNDSFGSFSAVGSMAAYSSFMDQTRKTFFLGGGSGAGAWGLNVETLTELALSSIPNWKIGGDPINPAVPKRQICGFEMETHSNMGYALSGDLEGNLLTASGSYTFAHEPVGNLIFGSRGSRNLIVAKQSCVESGGSDCTEAAGMCRQYNLETSIGPMSAVGDGRLVGIQRGNTSQVFLLSAKDPNDLSKGLEVEKIADISGDAYMYNDFTRAALHSPSHVRVFDFNALEGFKSGKAVRKVAAGWSGRLDVKEELKGLKLELKCIKQGVDNEAPYKDYTSILKSNSSLFTLAEEDCSGDVNAMEVKTSSDGTMDNFTRLSTFEIRGAQ